MIIVWWIGSGNFLYLMKLNIREHILIACGKQEEKTSEALSLTISPFLLNITPVRKLWIPYDVTSVILVSQTIKRRPHWCPKPVLWHINERKVGVVVRALTSHQCGPGSGPGVDITCGLSLLFVPHPKKPTLPNSSSIWNVRTQFNGFSRTPKCYVGKQITNYNLKKN